MTQQETTPSLNFKSLALEFSPKEGVISGKVSLIETLTDMKVTQNHFSEFFLLSNSTESF